MSNQNSDTLWVRGDVKIETEFNYDDLSNLEGQTDIAKLDPRRQGRAIPLSSIIQKVAVHPDAAFVTLTSRDGDFSASVPLEPLGKAVILYQLNDKSLSDKKGGPFRFLIPEIDSCATGEVDKCANVKFLAEIFFSREKRNDTRPSSPRAHKNLHEKEKNN